MFKPAPKTSSKQTSLRSLDIKMRAGIAGSILYPMICALFIRPSQEKIIPFLAIGILPVAVVWAFVWILAAKK